MDKQTIVDYVKHTPNNSNPAVLGSLLNQFEDSAGSKLPEVTEEDNGKVLKVVDGEWDKGEAKGGTYKITLSVDDNGVYHTDKTLSEIIAAHNSGLWCYVTGELIELAILKPTAIIGIEGYRLAAFNGLGTITPGGAGQRQVIYLQVIITDDGVTTTKFKIAVESV